MIIKVSKATEQQEYVWEVASGEWFATAVQQRFATRAEAVSATRAELERVAALTRQQRLDAIADLLF